MKRSTTMIAILLATIGALGCSSSGGGVPVPPPVRLVFAPAAAPSAQTLVADLEAGGSNDRIGIELLITDVNDVFAAGFVLNYDPAIADFDIVDTSGSLLGADGTQVQILVNDVPGALQVGISRFQSTTGTDFVGTGLLLKIYFTRVGNSGTAPLNFTNETLTDSSTPPQPIGGVQWFGGTLQVN